MSLMNEEVTQVGIELLWQVKRERSYISILVFLSCGVVAIGGHRFSRPAVKTNENIARIANAVQVTICLLVSTSIYFRLLVSSSVY